MLPFSPVDEEDDNFGFGVFGVDADDLDEPVTPQLPTALVTAATPSMVEPIPGPIHAGAGSEKVCTTTTSQDICNNDLLSKVG